VLLWLLLLSLLLLLLLLLLMLVLLQLCLPLLGAVSVSRCCGLCRAAAVARVACFGPRLLLRVG